MQPVQEQPTIASGRVGYAAMTVARLFLGVAMMPYAIDKTRRVSVQGPSLELRCSAFAIIPFSSSDQ